MSRRPIFLALVGSVAAFSLTACASSSGDGPPNVRESREIGRALGCPDNEGCAADYERFIERAREQRSPVSQEELDRSLLAIARGEVGLVEGPISRRELRDAVLDGLNIRFLVEGLDERPLEAVIVREAEVSSHLETELLFIDPYVGELQGLFLRPRGEGPFPAVVAIHGHGDDAFVYRDRYHGGEYPGRGYAILILTMRAMGIDETEHEISRSLLLEGFTLIGLRTYESLLGSKYLRHRGDILHERIGLIGHSGGSSTGNLTVHATGPDPGRGFRAYVSDHEVTFFLSSPFEPYHCETVPALYPYHRLINDFSGSPIPVLRVPYGYPFGMDGIFRFFGEELVR